MPCRWSQVLNISPAAQRRNRRDTYVKIGSRSRGPMMAQVARYPAIDWILGVLQVPRYANDRMITRESSRHDCVWLFGIVLLKKPLLIRQQPQRYILVRNCVAEVGIRATNPLHPALNSIPRMSTTCTAARPRTRLRKKWTSQPQRPRILTGHRGQG